LTIAFSQVCSVLLGKKPTYRGSFVTVNSSEDRKWFLRKIIFGKKKLMKRNKSHFSGNRRR
jgi:hypothetical protein